MTSWKTDLAGWISLLAGAFSAAGLSAVPMGGSVKLALALGLAGVGLSAAAKAAGFMSARDNRVSDEQAGAGNVPKKITIEPVSVSPEMAASVTRFLDSQKKGVPS